MSVLDHDDTLLDAPAPDQYLPTRRVTTFLADLESLADSWNSLAVTYRLMPGGFWARVTNNDSSRNADVLEGAARQLDGAIQRFKDTSDAER